MQHQKKFFFISVKYYVNDKTSQWTHILKYLYAFAALYWEMYILPTLPGGAQVDDLEPPGLITSLPTVACFDRLARDRSQWRAVVTASKATHT